MSVPPNFNVVGCDSELAAEIDTDFSHFFLLRAGEIVLMKYMYRVRLAVIISSRKMSVISTLEVMRRTANSTTVNQ